MKSTDVLNRLIALEAKIDPHLFQKNNDDDDDDDSGGLVAPAVGAGVGAGLVGGGYLANRYIMKNYGGEGGAGQAYQNVGRNIARNVSERLAAAKAGVQSGVGTVQEAAAPALAAAGSGVKTATGAVTGAAGTAAGAVQPFASKAAEHVATGIAAAKTGALDVLSKLKGKMPMLIPYLAKIGLQEHFHGRLVELDAHLDSFLQAHEEQRRRRTATKVAALGVGAAATAGGAVVGHRAIVRHGGYGAVGRQALSEGKVILGSISTLGKAKVAKRILPVLG